VNIAIFIMTPIVLVAALTVRFAGDARVLNVVDYSRVSDPKALHTWAGNRLLVLAAICAAFAGGSVAFPQASRALLGAAVIAVVTIAIWIAAGSARFQAVQPRAEA
jgi:hypothetical protein